jgi:hypothetical protein
VVSSTNITTNLIVGHGNLMRAATGGAYASEAGRVVYAPRAGSEPGVELVAPADARRLDEARELVGEDG